MVKLQTTISGIKMRNPFLLASGVLGVNASLMKRIAKRGCGGIITKSIGVEPNPGYKNPTVVELGNGSLLNAMGLPNPGCNYFLEELRQAKKTCQVPIIASIYGKDTDEFLQVAQTLEKAKPAAFELNISCPHGGRYGASVGEDCALVKEITHEIKKKVNVPVFVKISPNLTDILEPIKAAINGGADGIVLINTVKAMAIDITFKKPILSNIYGGLSGPAIKPIALRCIYEVFEEIGDKIPIIGVGGITTWQDVVEFFLAGASAVQIGTALAYCQDPVKISIFDELITGLQNYLEREEISHYSELIGVAHE
ncbi:MAG: dihydroorotate dehydrogenase [Asgard group archaeon]|nr:dihydroorotate dehydrogenase [Asgard group archaeon]